MARQSHPPRILLTRPAAQSRRFAASVRRAVALPLRITISPLMRPVLLPDAVPGGPVAALIFTSETGVAAYAAQPQRIAAIAYCVGDRTARAARNLGLRVVSAGGDAEALIALLKRASPPGALLHLRGRDARGDVAPRLVAAGLQAAAAIVYDQAPCPPTPAALRLLRGTAPVILPLFSPRSARLFAASVTATAPLHIIAMSPAVADALPPSVPDRLVIAQHPTAEAMAAAVKEWLIPPASA
jgi:uroporphyrinogen-III synthase